MDNVESLIYGDFGVLRVRPKMMWIEGVKNDMKRLGSVVL